MRVLIIDDEEDICFLVGSILRKNKFTVTSSNTLQEGIELAGSVNPGIIFLDNNLPDGSGIDTIPFFKNVLAEVKIIIISAFDSDEEKEKAFTNGADAFIGKPFSKERIEQTTNEILNAG